MVKLNHNPTNSLKTRVANTIIVGLGGISAGIYLFNFKIKDFVPVFTGIAEIELYVIMFLVLSALYFCAVLVVLKKIPKYKSSWSLTAIIIISAIAFRFCLIPSDPKVLSKDMYRYIWDGRVQQNGINPYLYPPGAKELEDLRDDRIFPNINRKDYRTLYPAGAQIFFRIFYILAGDSVSAHKGIMVLFDIFTLLILKALLLAYGFDASRLIVYAWNPLVIFEIAYSGHLEGLTVFLMVAAIYLYTIHKKYLAIIMLALSAAVKMYPALLLVAFLNRGDRLKGIVTFSATVILLYIPFLGAGSKIAGFLPLYLKNPYESFNAGLKHFLMLMIPAVDYFQLSLFFFSALAIAGMVVCLKRKEHIEVIRGAYILTGLLMILMPSSLHPWYVILLIPYLVFYPNPAWLIFTCTVTFSYLKYTTDQGIMPNWVLLVEYLPLFALLVIGYMVKKYNSRGRTSGMVFSNKNEELAESP